MCSQISSLSSGGSRGKVVNIALDADEGQAILKDTVSETGDRYGSIETSVIVDDVDFVRSSSRCCAGTLTVAMLFVVFGQQEFRVILTCYFIPRSVF